ncbi:hypothetical protein U27_05233 [Candidatus Vecturithrix granuli]|uniref:Uncharacterized protein n=1 Tax=Vecturithrix granuli TaxID=1499967 RepID=A0A081C105_VECG1|nr:hypothetical protein U27_05233 [Candidatus Vecturithrix granuli]
MKKSSTFGKIVRDILGKDEKRSHLEKEIVKLAQRKGGRLSILEIVAETSMSTKEADEIMEEMTVKGYVIMDVTESGGILYTFPGIVEKAQQEKQEWFKREVTRETVPSQLPKSQPPDGQRSIIRHDASGSRPPFPLPEQRTQRSEPAPPPPPKPKVTPKIEAQGFIFELQECKRSGNNILCIFQVKSNKQNKKLAIRPGVKVLDQSGKQYSARVQVLSGEVENTIEYIWMSLRAWISLKFQVTINMGSWQTAWQIKTLSLLELSCKDDILGPEFTAPFRDISLS